MKRLGSKAAYQDRYWKIQRAVAGGLTIPEACEEFGVSRSTVLLACNKFGAPPTAFYKPTYPGRVMSKPSEKTRRVLAMRDAGRTQEEVGEAFGMTRQAVAWIEKRWRCND